MRIMIVTDQYPPMVGGVPSVTHGLAVDFAQRGHSVWVIAPSYGTQNMHSVEQGVHVYRYSSFEWPTYEGLRVPFLPFLPVRKLLKKVDPDIIHIHSPVVLGTIAQLLAGGLRKPVIATNHYLPINLSPSLAPDSLIGKHFSNITYSYLVHFCNHCEYVTAPTATALSLLYEHGLQAPAQAISNGVDLKRFKPGERDEELRQRLKLPADQPIGLSMNRLSPEKRLDVLIDATAKTKSNVHIAIAGTGPAEEDLRAQVAHLQMEDRVSFLGFIDEAELPALYRLADLFVIPSIAELQSLTTMEAMASGLPIIAANAYALSELVHPEENGFLFAPGNSEEMASYIDELARDETLRTRMGTKSLELITKHDRQQVLNQWEELYRHLIKEFVEVKKRKRKRLLRRKQASYVKPKMRLRLVKL